MVGVDEETEILTADGWKTVHDLRVGDEALTLNHETGTSEWQPVLEVHAFPAERREMIGMEGRGHSSLTTPDHYWPAITGNGRRVWKTTEKLNVHHKIPLAAMCASVSQEAKYTDAFVELVAWFWTEGDTPGKRNLRISQSLKNRANVDRIDAVLREVFGPPVERLGQGLPEPRWRRDVDEGRNVRFTLNAVARACLLAVAPARVVSFGLLCSLTPAQLDLFIEVSMLADNSGPTRLAQRNRAAAESFQFAAILAGHATSLLERVYKPRESVPVTRDGRYSMWGVTLQKRRWFTPVANLRMARNKGYVNAWVMERVEHDQIVWCPCTENMTWLARRNGHCYFTGAVPTGSQKLPQDDHYDPQFRRVIAKRLRAEGMTLREIASQVGVSAATVLHDLRRDT
jgi:Helix-turn-helix domain